MTTTGVFAGVFDLLHPGHLARIAEAEDYCDYLIIALQIDPTIERPEKTIPIETVMERTLRLRALWDVDEVIVYLTENDLRDLIIGVCADIVFAGVEHQVVTGQDLPRLEIYRFDRPDDWSSSGLRQRIRDVE